METVAVSDIAFKKDGKYSDGVLFYKNFSYQPLKFLHPPMLLRYKTEHLFQKGSFHQKNQVPSILQFLFQLYSEIYFE